MRFKFLMGAVFASAMSCSVPSMAQQSQDRMATEVFAAAAEGDIARLADFVTAGYDLDYQRNGKSALGLAVWFGRTEAVRWLLARGADPETTSYDEYVAGFEKPRAVLQLAEGLGKHEIVSLLRAAGAGGGLSRATVPPVNARAENPLPVRAPAEKPSSRVVRKGSGGDFAWPAHNAFAAGSDVLITTNGGVDWRPATIERIGAGEFERTYLVRDAIGQTHYLDWTKVTETKRQPYWTGYFVGDWDVNTGIASNFRTDGRDTYHIISGGMRLPPLRINADGSYLWSSGSGSPIRGTWKARTEGPGIVLLKGDKGRDWTLVNSATRSTHDVLKADEIRLFNDVYSRLAHRIGG